ncbi:MAG: MlaE family lipid ABC transporter permease subunit [Rhizomicrobium sp.]|nr:MlaE family lipid ABC transporter permease subunit [Rhizomicrobium sp.]
MNASTPWFRVDHDGQTLRLTAGGPWTVYHAVSVDAGLRAIVPNKAAVAEIDASQIEALDTTGAWLLLRTRAHLKDAGLKIARFEYPESYRPLVGIIESEHLVAPAEVVTHVSLGTFLERLGRSSHAVLILGVGILGYLGRITIEWFKTIYAPQRHFRFTATAHQIEQVGINALPIVGLLMFLVGIVLAYQGADQLSRYGLDILTVNALGIGVLRELGVLITAIIIAGRSGSAFTAEIGTMKVNEEIDAMQTMGLNIDDVLILPRVTGLVIALPFLTFFANIMALIGGAMMCYFQLGITVPAFIRQLHEAVNVNTFLVGMIKAPVFAYVIGMVGCYEGLNVERNAASVGKLTTRAVVESVFLVIVLDAGFSVMFSILGF